MVHIVPSELALHSRSEASVLNHVSVFHVFGGPDTKATPQKLSYSTSLDGLGAEPGLEVSAVAVSGERGEGRRLGDPSVTSTPGQSEIVQSRNPRAPGWPRWSVDSWAFLQLLRASWNGGVTPNKVTCAD